MSSIKRARSIFTKTLAAIAILLIIVFFVVQRKSRDVEESRVAVIDVIGNNYIVRGSSPLREVNGKNELAYEKLSNNIREALKAKGAPDIQDFYLVNVSLFDINEFFLARDERNYFAEHPELGEIINISLITPSMLIEDLGVPYLSARVADHYDAWMTQTLEQIHDLAKPAGDKPRIIFVHCNSGRDRTGLFAATYRLLYDKASSVKDLRAINKQEAGRHAKPLFDRAIQSYCHYLNSNSQKNFDCE